MQTVSMRCKICEMEVLTKMPSSLDHDELVLIEKHYACNNCIREGRNQREDVVSIEDTTRR